MAIDSRIRLGLALVSKIVLAGTLAGAVYGYATTIKAGGDALGGLARGILTGGLVSVALASLNVFVLEAEIGAPLRRLPFVLHLILKSLFYLGVFLIGLVASQRIFPIGSAGPPQIELDDVLFFFAVSLVISFIVDVNRLLGQNVLLNFMTGRYFQPRIEQRIFLMIDMKGSTAAAERLGEVGFHHLLNRFIGDLSGAVAAEKGEIHKYVGDEMIVTWPLADGLKDARCLRACFAAIGRLAALAPSYEQEFGASVSIRSGLHCGPVVAGEMGTVKKEITLIGDTVNTAARIVDACRASGDAVLASGALLDQLALPPGITARALGPIVLRGKQDAITLFALSKVQ